MFRIVRVNRLVARLGQCVCRQLPRQCGLHAGEGGDGVPVGADVEVDDGAVRQAGGKVGLLPDDAILIQANKALVGQVQVEVVRPAGSEGAVLRIPRVVAAYQFQCWPPRGNVHVGGAVREVAGEGVYGVAVEALEEARETGISLAPLLRFRQVGGVVEVDARRAVDEFGQFHALVVVVLAFCLPVNE